MITAIVVDDEALTAEHIGRLLRKHDIEVLETIANPTNALVRIVELQPDLLMLDIEMPEMSGLELAERAQEAGYDGIVVFLTAYREYALDAFSVSALDYLLKPVSSAALAKTLEKVERRNAEKLAAAPARPSLQTVNVALFGSVLLHVGEGAPEPIRWTTAKCAELFAFLLLNGGERGISKGKALDAIWPYKNAEKADINLRSTVSRLNKTLRESGAGLSVQSAGNSYRLHFGESRVEADAFALEALASRESAVTADNAESYFKAVTSYRETLLEEVDAEWIRPFREKYHAHFVDAVRKLTAYYEEARVEALKRMEIYELLLKYEPYDDHARGKALRLRFNLQGRDGAEQYYREYEKLLATELGIKPGPYARQTYEDLLN